MYIYLGHVEVTKFTVSEIKKDHYSINVKEIKFEKEGNEDLKRLSKKDDVEFWSNIKYNDLKFHLKDAYMLVKKKKIIGDYIVLIGDCVYEI